MPETAYPVSCFLRISCYVIYAYKLKVRKFLGKHLHFWVLRNVFAWIYLERQTPIIRVMSRLFKPIPNIITSDRQWDIWLNSSSVKSEFKNAVIIQIQITFLSQRTFFDRSFFGILCFSVFLKFRIAESINILDVNISHITT